jgi:class 3 adenylate cyclase
VRAYRAADHVPVAVAVQPSGTVTFVFTDVEGSTTLLDELGAEAYREVLAGHRRTVREAFAAYAG